MFLYVLKALLHGKVSCINLAVWTFCIRRYLSVYIVYQVAYYFRQFFTISSGQNSWRWRNNYSCMYFVLSKAQHITSFFSSSGLIYATNQSPVHRDGEGFHLFRSPNNIATLFPFVFNHVLYAMCLCLSMLLWTSWPQTMISHWSQI